MTPLDVGWGDAVGWVVSAALGFAGGALSGDLVAKRAFRREQRARAAALLADWRIVPTGTAMAELRNTGDETGTDVRLFWVEGSTGRLTEETIERIDPGDFRRLMIAPIGGERLVQVTWSQPDGQTRSVTREVPRFTR